MSIYHDFSITRHQNGRLEIHDVPPVGAVCAFSLELLANMEVGASVDSDGHLTLRFERRSAVGSGRPFMPIKLVLEPVRFDPDNVMFGPLRMLACRRIA